MSLWVAVGGLLAGLGCWLLASELIPAGAKPAGCPGPARFSQRAATTRLPSSSGSGAAWPPRRRGCQCRSADLRLLGQDPAAWLARKVGYAIIGLALVPVLSALILVGGRSLPPAVPVGGTLALGTGMFFLPDLVTRVNARAEAG